MRIKTISDLIGLTKRDWTEVDDDDKKKAIITFLNASPFVNQFDNRDVAEVDKAISKLLKNNLAKDLREALAIINTAIDENFKYVLKSKSGREVGALKKASRTKASANAKRVKVAAAANKKAERAAAKARKSGVKVKPPSTSIGNIDDFLLFLYELIKDKELQKTVKKAKAAGSGDYLDTMLKEIANVFEADYNNYDGSLDDDDEDDYDYYDDEDYDDEDYEEDEEDDEDEDEYDDEDDEDEDYSTAKKRKGGGMSSSMRR